MDAEIEVSGEITFRNSKEHFANGSFHVVLIDALPIKRDQLEISPVTEYNGLVVASFSVQTEKGKLYDYATFHNKLSFNVDNGFSISRLIELNKPKIIQVFFVAKAKGFFSLDKVYLLNPKTISQLIFSPNELKANCEFSLVV